MKILHLTYGANTSSAVTRLSAALNTIGEKSDVMAVNLSDDVRGVKVNTLFFVKSFNHIKYILENKRIEYIYPKRTNLLYDISDYGVINKKIENIIKEYDIVNLHYINGMISFSQMEKITKLNVPIVWTMHDCWAFTGGCHHGCDKFSNECGKCFVLNSNKENDISNKCLNKKKVHYKDIKCIISPSNWMNENISKSAVFKGVKHLHIPNGVDLTKFKNVNEPQKERDKIKVLIGAASPKSSPYKGYKYIVETMRMMQKQYPQLAEKIEICFFGSGVSLEDLKRDFPDCYKIVNHGFIKDEQQLASIYSDADVFLAPSIYDNLPTTLIESIACGTPCVGFDTGGISDIIIHKKNGWLAERKNSKQLLEGLLWVIENNKDNTIGIEARKYAENNFDDVMNAKKYMEMYQKIIQQ